MSFRSATLSLIRRIVLEQSVRSGPQTLSRRLAGHSHWQNTRHIKAEKDAHKAKTTERHVRLIQLAVRNGGSNPKLNKSLEYAITQAKRTQVITQAAIDTAIKRATEAKKDNPPVAIGFHTTNGVCAVVNCTPPSVSKMQHDCKAICRKFGWAPYKGQVKDRFREKGFVNVNGKSDGSDADPDETLMVAIEHGAEEMNEIKELKTLEFVCEVNDYSKLAHRLQDAGYSVSDAGITYIPFSTVEVPEEQLENIGNFCDALEEHPDVVSVFTNVA